MWLDSKFTSSLLKAAPSHFLNLPWLEAPPQNELRRPSSARIWKRLRSYHQSDLKPSQAHRRENMADFYLLNAFDFKCCAYDIVFGDIYALPSATTSASGRRKPTVHVQQWAVPAMLPFLKKINKKLCESCWECCCFKQAMTTMDFQFHRCFSFSCASGFMVLERSRLVPVISYKLHNLLCAASCGRRHVSTRAVQFADLCIFRQHMSMPVWCAIFTKLPSSLVSQGVSIAPTYV